MSTDVAPLSLWWWTVRGAGLCFHYPDIKPGSFAENQARFSTPPAPGSAPWLGAGDGAAPHQAHTPSLTRVQLLGGRAELGIFCDPVSDIRAFGRSPCCTEACGLGYSVRQVVKI